MSPFACNGSPAPPTVPAPPIPGGARPCCLLMPHAGPTGDLGVGIVDPTAAGSHHFGGGDIYGMTYTCAGGFFDTGHARDTIDVTRYHHHQLAFAGKNAAGVSYPAIYPGATVKILSAIPAADVLETAAAITYDEAVWHEIESWYDMGPGGHHSSFSPEDLSSNFYGTWVARQAIILGGLFDASATLQLTILLSRLGARPKADTQAAFTAITGRWVAPSSSYALAGLNGRYLLRRNFNVDPIQPWLAPGISFCASTAWPAGVPMGFGAAIRGRYDVEFTVPPDASVLGTTVRSSGFGAAIAMIKAEAVQPGPPVGTNARGYGPDFDKP